MTGKVIEVIRPGALTTVQDLGRPGCQNIGVTPGGAMDPFALSAANILAGNPPGSAALEVTLLGPTLKFHCATIVGLAGADLSARVNDHGVSPWCSFEIRAGDILTFGPRRSGARAYAAFQGGIDVPDVLGSKSTDLRSKFGGHQGRALARGDELQLCAGALRRSSGGRSLMADDLERVRPSNLPIRITRQRNRAEMSETQWQAFFHTEFVIRPDSDRMGIRLDNEPLHISEAASIATSRPSGIGTIQLPPSGLPIILMADRQTVGGYAAIGTVASADVGRLAQIAPGETVQFTEISINDAQSLIIAERTYILMLKTANS